MILDSIDRIDTYEKLVPQLALVKNWLTSLDEDVHPLSEGKTELDGEKIFVKVSKNMGKGEQGATLEYHRRYIDVQIALQGKERIGWLPLESCQTPANSFDPVKDIGFYTDAPATWFDIIPGWFCIFFPEDAHAPLAGEGPLKKALLKIEV
jgi:YhcH/YjgK/YiaL family protein